MFEYIIITIFIILLICWYYLAYKSGKAKAEFDKKQLDYLDQILKKMR